MAQQQITLPAPHISTSSRLQWGFSTPLTGIEIGSDLLEGSGPAYLKILQFDGGGAQLMWTSADDAPDEFGGGAGPHMSAAWENSATAIVLMSDHGVLTIPGPGLGLSTDETEPYRWIPTNAVKAAIGAFISGWSAGSALEMLLDDTGSADADSFSSTGVYYQSQRLERVYYRGQRLQRLYWQGQRIFG